MRSKTEEAYSLLRDAITYGELKPSEALVEEKICRQFKVGRTPLREALRQLKMMGYVDIVLNKGAVVTAYSEEDVGSIYNIIAILEGYATKLAAEYIQLSEKRELSELQKELKNLGLKKEYKKWLEVNDLFHGYFHNIARNIHLTRSINDFREKIYRYRFIAIKIPGHMEECIKDHDRILEYVFDKNAKMAGETMMKHVHHSKDILLDFIKLR
ncbi:MAG: GntR family transcriptional regulator [Desulfobacteria bacterium]